MNEKELLDIVKNIVLQASYLKDKYTDEVNASLNYACIFSQSESEYTELESATKKIGKRIKETKSGYIYHIRDIETNAGILKILKIRVPDVTKPERGDADFTVSNYQDFKKKYLPQPQFLLIKRPYMEMIELMEKGFIVRTYFSDPPLDKQLL